MLHYIQQRHRLKSWILSQVIGMTVMMFVIDYLSPFGYRARARESDEEPGNEFNLLNSLWFATASVLQQGPDNTPLAPSGRLLASAFWFFIMILISTYTANLAAFFTSKYWCVYIEWCKHGWACRELQSSVSRRTIPFFRTVQFYVSLVTDHVRYINILTWLRGFRVKIIHF